MQPLTLKERSGREGGNSGEPCPWNKIVGRISRGSPSSTFVIAFPLQLRENCVLVLRRSEKETPQPVLGTCHSSQPEAPLEGRGAGEHGPHTPGHLSLLQHPPVCLLH